MTQTPPRGARIHASSGYFGNLLASPVPRDTI